MPTRTGYVFLGWRGDNLANINRGINCYLDSAVIKNDTVTAVSTPHSNDEDYASFRVPIDDLSDGLYLLSVDSISYSGECNNPYIMLAGEYNIGRQDVCASSSSDHSFQIDYSKGQKYVYINFSNYSKRFNENVKSDSLMIEIHISNAINNQNYTSGTVTFSNLMLTKVPSENEFVAYEPYYIESDTVFGTPGVRTLTAMWSSNNILTGGALQTATDLAKWGQVREDSTETVTKSVANIVTEDGYSCTKLDTAFNKNSYIYQSIKGKYEIQRCYSITAKIKLSNMTVGVYDPSDVYNTSPMLAFYFPGSSTSGWLNVMTGHSLVSYNNKGWLNVKFTSITHPESFSTITANQVIDADVNVRIRNYTGDFYIRDFAIAKM